MTSSAALAASEAATRPLRAMCIDDEAVDLMLNLRILSRCEDFGEILTFPDAEQALDFLRGHQGATIDVIFLDVNMPRMTGFEFLEAATAELGPRFARGVVIMLTTSLRDADKARAARFDVIRDYLPKPLSPEKARAVANLVQRLG